MKHKNVYMSVQVPKLGNSRSILPQTILSTENGARQFNSCRFQYRTVSTSGIRRLSSARVIACGILPCKYVVLALKKPRFTQQIPQL